ncbi:MAG: hypothetical protein U0229_12805 [Anaeromyxobacter sp.]
MAPSGSRPREALVAAAALAVAGALVFAPALLGDGQFLYRDAGRMHHPVKRWFAEELRRGHLAEWNPYQATGMPHVAGAVDAPLHPFNALFLALPFEAAFKAWVLLAVLGAGLGAWWWARRLGAGPAGGITAGLAFMLSGFVVSSTDNPTYLTTLAAVPWVLAAAHRAVEVGGAAPLLWAGVASFVALAGGDPMGWVLVLGLAAVQALALVRGPSPGTRAARGAATLAVAVLAAAPALLPTLLWAPHSSRAAGFDATELSRWNLHPLRLLELVVPGLLRWKVGALRNPLFEALAGNEHTQLPWVLSVYSGAAALALAALGALRDARARWLLGLALVFVWMALGPNAGFGQLAAALPVLSSLRYWEKAVASVALLVAVAAGLGVDRLLADPRAEGRRLAVVAGAGAAGLGLLAAAAALAPAPLAALVAGARGAAPGPLAGAFVDNLAAGGGAAAVALGFLAGIALAVRSGRLQGLAAGVVCAVVALDLGASAVTAYVLAPPALLEEPSPIAARLAAEPGLPRVVTPFQLSGERWPELSEFEARWRWLARTSAPALQVARRIGNFDAYAGLVPARLMRIRRAAGPEALAGPASVLGFGAVVVPAAPELAAKAGLAPPYEVLAVDPALPVFLVRLPSRPRVGLAGALVEGDEQAALDFVLSRGAVASGRSVLEGPVPDGYRAPAGEARLVEDRGERLVVDAAADAPALVFVNDTFAPGWAASVDGAPAPILAVNLLARGVWIPAGRHRVELEYRTPGLRAGAALAGVTLAALAAAALIARRRRAARGA